MKLFIGNYLIIINLSDILLYKDINISLLKQKNKEELITDLILFKNKFIDIFDFTMKNLVNDIINNEYNFEIIKNKIVIAFKSIFGFGMDDKNDNIEKKRIENIANYYFNNIINFIASLYPNSDIVSPVFGEKIMENSIKMKYCEELINKYIDFFKSRINNIIFRIIYFMNDNEDILFYIKNKADEKYTKEILPIIKPICSKNLDLKENPLTEIIDKISKIKLNPNPNIELLINICNNINNKKDFSIDKLDDIFKNYLYYIVWEYKGKMFGIHNDFGRVSLMRINEIDSKFFCNDEDRIKCCQELIQRLIDADEKKF